MIEYKNNVRDVINTNAVNVEDTYFFATHSEFQNLKYSRSGKNSSKAILVNEQHLFEDFFLKEVNQHNFVVVQGDNGTGKSHFIKWIKHKYSISLDPEKYETIFISRQNSTLQNALRQFVQSEFFRNDDKLRSKFDILLNAESEQETKALMDTFLSNLANIILNDEQSKFSKPYREPIFDFFNNLIIRNNLLNKSSGFVDRVKEKLISDQNKRIEVEPQMVESDLDIDIKFLEELKKDYPRSKVLRLAEKLRDDNAFKKDLIDYVNQKIGRAIQKTVHLNTVDFQNIFRQMRTELKLADKNLIFLIEDITSLTGLDRAMVEVLTEESASSDGEMCNLFSVIGITTGYYNAVFPDNIKDRVSFRIEIDFTSLFKTEDDVICFASKYISALHQAKKHLDEWVAEGAESETRPELDIKSFPQWSLNANNVLFPLSKNVIVNLYNELPVQERTPRRFLMSCLKPLLEDYYGDLTTYPSSGQDFEMLGLNVKTLTSREKEVILPRINESTQLERFFNFYRLYSNQQFEIANYDNENYFAGVSDSMMKQFGFTFEFYEGQASVEPSKKIIETTIENKPPEKAPAVDIKAEKAYSDQIQLLKDWRNHAKPMSGKEIRQTLVEVLAEILGSMDFQLRRKEIKERISIQNFTFTEKQFNPNLYVFNRNDENFELVMSILRYRYEGKLSWTYEDSLRDIRRIKVFIQKNIVFFQKLLTEEVRQGVDINIEEMLVLVFFQNRNLVNLGTLEIYKEIFDENFPCRAKKEISKIEKFTEVLQLNNNKHLFKKYRNFDVKIVRDKISDYLLAIGDTDPVNSHETIMQAVELLSLMDPIIKRIKLGKYYSEFSKSLVNIVEIMNEQVEKQTISLYEKTNGIDYMNNALAFFSEYQSSGFPIDYGMKNSIEAYNATGKFQMIMKLQEELSTQKEIFGMYCISMRLLENDIIGVNENTKKFLNFIRQQKTMMENTLKESSYDLQSVKDQLSENFNSIKKQITKAMEEKDDD